MSVVYPLRGRDRPLASLEGLASAAAGGHGGVAIVEGPAGIGKTRLLEEASAVAHRLGFLIASGAADELDQVTPWGMLLAALSSTDPPLVAPDELRAFAVLLDRRLEVVDRLRVLLEEAAARQPIAVILDDLQWADAATLLAVGSLPRQLFSYPVLWILARRPVPSSVRMLSLVERLDRDGAVHVPLAELEDDEVWALAADVLGSRPDPALEKMVIETAGNPFYLVEALRSWKRGVVASSPDQLVASGGLTQVVERQLRSLSPAGGHVVKVASVIGSSFTVSELSSMTGQPASGLLTAIEETLDAGVFVENGGQLAFRHDLFRQAVYASIPAAMRAALHRDGADALLAAGVPIVRVATQMAIGAQPGDEAAIDVLTKAVGELFGTSPAAAGDLALRVLDLVTEEDPRWPGLVAMTVGVLGWAGRVHEALSVGQLFLAGRNVPVGLEAEIQNAMRRAWGQSGQAPFPTSLPDHLVTDPNIPASLRANLVVLTQFAATYLKPEEEVARALDEARDLLAGTDDADTSASLLGVRCNLAWEHGRVSEAYALAQAELDAARGTPPSFAAGTIESTVATALCTIGQSSAALELVGAAQEAASACGNPFLMTLCASNRAKVLLELGRVNDARAEARAAAETANDLGFRFYLGQSVGVLVETSIHQGDLSEASEAVQRLLSIWAEDNPSGERSWVVALCEDAYGRLGQAVDALTPVIRRLRRGRYSLYPSRLPRIVGIALRAGNSEYAQIATQAAVEQAERNPGVISLAANAAHAQGLLQSDPVALAHAFDLLSKGQQPLATALAQEDLARALAKSNQKDSAVTNFEAAYDAYVAADTYRDVARVRRALGGLGVRKRQRVVARPDRGWASLTKTESAVAEIVAQGHTNKEAAAQLYVSPETVNTHLRHVFTKLGVRSRVELARFVIDHETA